MSRTVAAGLSIGAETTSLAHAWKVILQDGTVLGFTDHDVNKTIGGVVYLASAGFNASAIETSGALNVDNMEITGMLSSPSIDEADLVAGRWDHAYIEELLYNWRDPTVTPVVQRVGRLGEISAAGAFFKAELRGLTQQLQQSIGQIYQPGCRADFGDSKCKFDKATVTFSATVSAISANGRVITAPALTQASDYFGAGELTWTSGPNDGLKGEIKSSAPGTITLQVPPPYLPSAGETFTAVAGCRKRFQEDCKTKFNNPINFRGEPHLPGLFKMVKGP